jgi:DNA-binding NarL/FixJ family response regulator
MTETSPGTPRILLVDDHPAIREWLSQLLIQNGLVVCGEAVTVAQTLDLLATARPDLVVVDLSLRKENGLDLVAALSARGVPSVVYSMYDDVLHIEAAFAAGALGYVTKRAMTTALMDAIREVLAGRRYLCPAAAQALAVHHLSGGLIDRLSEREREIFTRTGAGYSAADIARHFSLSISTVETHYTRICDKMGYNGIKELRRQAILYVTNN